MMIYLLDLAHTQSVEPTSIPIPLSIGYIKSYLMENHGGAHQVKLFKFTNDVLKNIELDKPDVVGFANYGWNENLNIKVGEYIRSLLPNALFVAGGPNIDPEPKLRKKFLEKFHFLDFAVINGGEEPFSELVSWWEQGKSKQDLPLNLIWLENGKLGSSVERGLNKKIRGIPSPYLNGYLDEFLALGMIPLLETNRGCPFKCTFCA